MKITEENVTAIIVGIVAIVIVGVVITEYMLHWR